MYRGLCFAPNAPISRTQGPHDTQHHTTPHHTTPLTQQGGFQLAGGSLLACDMRGAVRKIADHVKTHFPALRQRRSSGTSSFSRTASPTRKRALLVLDGCQHQVFVGQVRVSLRDLLKSLEKAFDAIGVSLTAAVTMREAGPTEPGRVGIPGEETVVVNALDARRCVGMMMCFVFLLTRLFFVCLVYVFGR